MIPFLLAEGEPQAQTLSDFLASPVVLLLGLGLLAYFFLLRPQKGQQKAYQEMLDNLKKNDKIRTVGGIYGTVVSVTPETGDVVIRIDETNNTKIRITRRAVATIVNNEEKESPSKKG
ncbi:MAG: preprotein translocase subunit YajC [Pirellulaceae bacterium]|nr:preprotein translocase subunit YajC [Pirellulaceae bacterium]